MENHNFSFSDDEVQVLFNLAVLKYAEVRSQDVPLAEQPGLDRFAELLDGLILVFAKARS